MLKNFLCSLKRQQYTGRSEAEGIKKPINAFLGEVFIGEFEGNEGGTNIISEQVSHHPPVTACYLWNDKHRISAEGYVAQETTFSTVHGVTVKQLGHAIIRLEEHGENYLMTLPTLQIKGLVTGSPYPELLGTMHIISNAGFTAEISFEGKKLLGLSGKKNCIDALLFRTADGAGKPLYEIEGQWNGKMSITVRDEQSQDKGKVIDEFDVNDIPATTITVVPEEQQNPWESRKAWGPTIKGIEAGDMNATSTEKQKIEQGQRKLRKQYPEIAEGSIEEWPRLFFSREEDDPVFDELAKHIGEDLAKDKTAGVWRFKGRETADKLIATRDFHPGLLPTGDIKDDA